MILKSPRSILHRFLLLAQFCGLLPSIGCVLLELPFYYLSSCRSRQRGQQMLNSWLLINLKVRLSLFLFQLLLNVKLNGKKGKSFHP